MLKNTALLNIALLFSCGAAIASDARLRELTRMLMERPDIESCGALLAVQERTSGKRAPEILVNEGSYEAFAERTQRPSFYEYGLNYGLDPDGYYFLKIDLRALHGAISGKWILNLLKTGTLWSTLDAARENQAPISRVSLRYEINTPAGNTHFSAVLGRRPGQGVYLHFYGFITDTREGWRQAPPLETPYIDNGEQAEAQQRIVRRFLELNRIVSEIYKEREPAEYQKLQNISQAIARSD